MPNNPNPWAWVAYYPWVIAELRCEALQMVVHHTNLLLDLPDPAFGFRDICFGKKLIDRVQAELYRRRLARSERRLIAAARGEDWRSVV